jgi:5-(carboxyamino)imidazole ribonucleotide synthase
VQDKFVQKQTLAAAGLPVLRFEAVANLSEVERAGVKLGWPLLLKGRRDAYDGKGNVTLRSFSDAATAWMKLGGNQGRRLFVEEFCKFTAELATIVTRGRDGASATYPVVETVQRNHVCHLVKAPAPVATEVAVRVAEVARQAAAAVGAVGSFGIEMFLKPDGQLVAKELAPRVHN